MTKNRNDEIARAYAKLLSIRDEIEKMTTQDIQETYVHEYHSALDHLSSVKIDVSEYRIPDSEVKPIVDTSITYVYDPRKGPTPYIYTKEKYVNTHYFLMKIKSVLNYFEIITSPEQKKIGFHKSE